MRGAKHKRSAPRVGTREIQLISRLRLRVTPDAVRQIRSGHPWLFADSIREQNREGEPGELAIIYDRNNKFLAVGLFDPDSPIRLRVLHTGKPTTIEAAWWRERLRAAIARRADLFDEQTTGYRCINGESDGWPGLVLDSYDATLVLKLYTAAWLPRLEEIVGLIREQLTPERIVLRLSRNIQERARSFFEKARHSTGDAKLEAESPPPHPTSGHPFPRVERGKGQGEGAVQETGDGAFLLGGRRDAFATFLESGLRFEADVVRGQKTGFFLDQRENRRIVGSLARGRDVLNAFSFTGGFSVYAARGGAKSVTDLDISAYALAGSKRNFVLNKSIPVVAAGRREAIQADAFEWLAGNASRKFDLTILDPPSLAKREAERAGAIQAYGRLAQSGIAHLRPGGVLVAASCSAHVSAEEFFGAVRLAAKKSGRKFSDLQTTGHAPDHPASFPEAHYLKCIYLQF
jgi:23S rRNA (cytosine1962-C5)-methyltransferase